MKGTHLITLTEKASTLGESVQACAYSSWLGDLLAGTSIFSAAPCHSSCPKKVSREERCRDKSPVHSLLTSPPADVAAGPSASAEHGRCVRKCGSPEGAAVPQTSMCVQFTDASTVKALQTVGYIQPFSNSVDTTGVPLSFKV